jgi:hypothetical protein
VRSGHCSDCQRLVWRTAIAQRDTPDGTKAGEVFLLWPRPESLYAKVRTPEGFAPGIAYCPECAPQIGQPGPVFDGAPVIGYETAYGRYTAWYADEKREFWQAWLHDHLSLTGSEVSAYLDQWEKDRSSDPI